MKQRAFHGITSETKRKVEKSSCKQEITGFIRIIIELKEIYCDE